MDKELVELENELRALRPRAPSAVALQNVERRLKRRVASPVARIVMLGVPLAAAAALMVVLWPGRVAQPSAISSSKSASEAPGAAFQPVSAENLLVEARDDGLVQLGDGTPARQFRQVYVDRITWKNPTTQASVTWTVPREELRVVPISYQ